MTNLVIDNSSNEDFGRIILWQYDKAYNLIDLIKSFLGIVDNTAKVLWDKYITELNIDDSTDYGLAILGTLTRCRRPEYNGEKISTELYRRIIRAYAFISHADYTIPELNKYLNIIFEGAVTCSDNFDMSVTLNMNESELTEEEKYLIKNEYDYIFPFPVAVREKKTFDRVLFSVVETQPTDPKIVTQNGIPVGCLDDSTFTDDSGELETQYIPEEERT